MNSLIEKKDKVEFYNLLPKVELHRHLEGSIRLQTLLEIGREYGLDLPNTVQLRKLVQIGNSDEYSFVNFLSKFETLRLFYRSPEIIERITRETIEDAHRDNVRYLELRFTPVALSRAEGLPLGEVMDRVIAGAQKAEAEFGIKTRLIVSVNRHEDVSMAETVTRLTIDRIGKGILGLDMAGNEAHHSGRGFQGLLKEARQAGLFITIHAGEWGNAENVSFAIQHLNADRIGHGVRVLEDPEITRLAQRIQIPFEVCITSNYQSGVVPSLHNHPLQQMVAQGLNLTINTDNPSISQITLSQEYQTACEELHLPYVTLKERLLAAAQASFLPEDEKSALIVQLNTELSNFTFTSL